MLTLRKMDITMERIDSSAVCNRPMYRSDKMCKSRGHSIVLWRREGLYRLDSVIIGDLNSKC